MTKTWFGSVAAALCLATPTTAALQGDDVAALYERFRSDVKANQVLVQAVRQIQGGSAAAAIPSLKAYTRADPANAEAWYLLSMAYSETNQQDLANRAIGRATSIKPQLNVMTRYLAERMASPAGAAAVRPAGNAPTTPPPSRPAASPPQGRYVCLAMGGVGGSDAFVWDSVFGEVGLPTVQNKVAPDVVLLPGGRYSNLGKTGSYNYDASKRVITWLDGSLASSKTNMVGVYVPAGQGAKYPTILIRSKSDIAEGNKRDLAWCNLS